MLRRMAEEQWARGGDAGEYYRKGEAGLRAAIAQGFAMGNLNLGIVCRRLGRLAEAIAAFRALAEAVPEHRAFAERQIAEIEKGRK